MALLQFRDRFIDVGVGKAAAVNSATSSSRGFGFSATRSRIATDMGSSSKNAAAGHQVDKMPPVA